VVARGAMDLKRLKTNVLEELAASIFRVDGED
jgi:hypothetical protein